MSQNITEADWKHFRKVHPIALERFCARFINDVAAITADSSKTAHERYSAIYELTARRDKELGRAFDDMRRSTALIQLATIASLGVLTGDDIASFSPSTRDSVAFLSGQNF